MVSKRDFDSAELETMRTSRSPSTLMTANGGFKPEKKRRCMSSNWIQSSKLCFLKKLPQFLEKLCEDHGFSHHWTIGERTTSHQKLQEN